jgi:hypothetical protein
MKNKKEKILKDHKKVGSKFIPPMSQLGMTEVSYVNQIFPEIIWMGLLNKREGYHKGIRIVEFMAKKSVEIKSTEKFLNFSLASSYTFLGVEQKYLLVDELKKNNYLQVLQKSLAPLTCLYEGFPMAFLGPPTDHCSKETMLTIFKECISACISKYEHPGMVMQANVMYIRGITGGLYFTNNIKPPNLEKILTDFDSDEGKMASASVRAMIMSEYMPMEGKKSDEWSRSFWNQGYKIDKCQFPWDKK